MQDTPTIPEAARTPAGAGTAAPLNPAASADLHSPNRGIPLTEPAQGSHDPEPPSESSPRLFEVAPDPEDERRRVAYLRLVASSARCILWSGQVEQHDGAYVWSLRIADDEAAQRVLPLDIQPGETYFSAWSRSRLEEDTARCNAVALNAFLEARDSYEQEFRCTQKDGAIRWLSEIVRIERLAPARWRLVGVCADVTDRKQSDEQITRLNQELEQRVHILVRLQEISQSFHEIYDLDLCMQRIFDAIQDFCRVDRGLFALVDEANGVLRGRKAFNAPDSLVADTVRQIYDAPHPDEDVLAAPVRTGQPEVSNDPLPPQAHRATAEKYGHRGPSVALPLKSRGKVVGVLGVRRSELPHTTAEPFTEQDVAIMMMFAHHAGLALENILLYEELKEHARTLEQRVQDRTAEILDANQELESFSYSVSHDLRGPLRSIDGFIYSVLEEYGSQLDATAHGYLDRARSASQRMGELIDDLLSLARVSRTEVHRRSVDLNEIVHNIRDDLQRADPHREVSWVIAPDLRAVGDSGLLRALLENLLSNAWKFTGARTPAAIEVGKLEEAGEIVFFVRDNGAGFDMKYAGKLFGAFQRLHSPSEFEGNGIGLATVQRIAHRHGGRAWAEGATGDGAVFYFTLGEHPSPASLPPRVTPATQTPAAP